VEPTLERARHYLDRRTTATFLATQGRERLPELTPVIGARFTPDGLLAVGEEEAVGGGTFRNLRLHPWATLLLLDPVTDPRSRDGLRLHLEFLGAEADGAELAHMTEWLSAFAPGRKVARRLIFKVVGLAPYRAEAPSPPSMPSRPPSP
jgi:hypothetical protein